MSATSQTRNATRSASPISAACPVGVLDADGRLVDAEDGASGRAERAGVTAVAAADVEHGLGQVGQRLDELEERRARGVAVAAVEVRPVDLRALLGAQVALRSGVRPVEVPVEAGLGVAPVVAVEMGHHLLVVDRDQARPTGEVDGLGAVPVVTHDLRGPRQPRTGSASRPSRRSTCGTGRCGGRGSPRR